MLRGLRCAAVPCAVRRDLQIPWAFSRQPFHHPQLPVPQPLERDRRHRHGIEMATLTPLQNNWLIQGNTFDGTRQGVFINANDNIKILDNSFTR